jgi:ubiquinone/menaquinone biosynthesis C-methylase UbiE
VVAVNDDVTAQQAASFDRAADVYERARPGYPPEAVDKLLEAGPEVVLDLGAGTGKLTRDLVGRVRQVHAVDPSTNMLAQLEQVLPGVLVSEGTAEDIPLPAESVDAVLAAQAWHWVDPERAEPEVDRVLRPGGTFGLIWNVRDETVPWVRELTAIISASAAERWVTSEHPPSSRFGPMEQFTFRWERPFDRQGLLDLVASRSYVITAEPEVRERILAGVGELLDTHPDLGEPASWRLPYRTDVFRATKS